MTLQAIHLLQLLQQFISSVGIGLQLNECLHVLGRLTEGFSNLCECLIELFDFVLEAVVKPLEQLIFVGCYPLEEDDLELGEVYPDHMVVVDKGIHYDSAVLLQLV